MSVSYDKLRVLLTLHKIKLYKLRSETGISISESVKINKDEYMTLQSIESIIKYLSAAINRQIKVEDILDFIDD